MYGSSSTWGTESRRPSGGASRTRCGSALTVGPSRLGPPANPPLQADRDTDAKLEVETEIDGVVVHGVDTITWNDAGRIAELKVMLRPLKAGHLIHQRMGALLQARRERDADTGA